MLGIAASKVPGTPAYLCWRENLIRLHYTVDNIDHFLALHILSMYFCWYGGETLKEAKVWGDLYNPTNECWHNESNLIFA